jgi:hypothetical protein
LPQGCATCSAGYYCTGGSSITPHSLAAITLVHNLLNISVNSKTPNEN